ncbi:hypothetical protein PKHYL_02190 [Psychrobacter sp. KH172YL61]|uniref:hypothetical protein n=1 Tax=Psychrobacter sp. KH172YL61 TaxID=2517899 RepID=UPI0010B129B4|nr:hypothetical protein [Psychrobacter sp. KH172YL61]BBI66028.1 hypothetical protein PKHYL_02190 [Psychrobacter sp. KH172YL61]
MTIFDTDYDTEVPKKRIFKAPVSTDRTSETDASPIVTKPYANAPINQLYRKLSGQLLDVAVKPKLLGELPDFDSDEQVLRFYVLQDYSRSNSIFDRFADARA